MISLIPICWLFRRLNSCGEQAIFNLDIKNKFGLSINPDIHHSKVFSSERVITVGYFRGLVLGVGGDYFLSQFTPFKMHLSCVSCTTWTKRIYSDNLFIYKHCINCIFYCSYIYPWIDHVNPQYIYPWIDHVNPQYVYTVVFVTEDYFGGKDILYNFFTRNYTGFKVI